MVATLVPFTGAVDAVSAPAASLARSSNAPSWTARSASLKIVKPPGGSGVRLVNVVATETSMRPPRGSTRYEAVVSSRYAAGC